MTYEQIVYTIDNKRRFGKACGRDVTKEFMAALGHPEIGMHIIHIAGTNGKGSVAAFVSSILQAASFSSDEPFKVGLFTSPHLIDYTERIQVDGRQIAREDVVRIGGRLLETSLSLEPTMFDYWLALAMVYFKEQGVKYVVLETGLGGDKDSTNGLSQPPEVCAITSIGLEHTQYLGDTIEQIAKEKAGIIKPNVPVVIGEMDEKAVSVITDKCRELKSPYIRAHEVEPDVELGLFGDYQRKNAAVAWEIAKNLKIELNSQIIATGLANAKWNGRMQVISCNPYVLIDGAHNPSGVTALRDSLMSEFPNEHFSFIMAVMADKDYLQMAEIIRLVADRVYTVTVDYSRALQSKELANDLKDRGFEAISCSSFDEAVLLAQSFDEKIIAFGSLYFIGEILHDKDQTGGL